ncbi:MAG: phage tail assembly protein [Candidatus Binatus sp.]|uniref:phage tail assembly protein n=1 Tax=Candidatus Binatus sp. TaxID=2811406 RepID=UPI00272894B8|nr:phage tail assembly protein [Candidatus Binatus sp.]MDO8433511.1 phage tail assembly protein [Candidatus Binatus sp.]
MTEDLKVNGVRVKDPEQDQESSRAIELPSGARAEVRKGLGRDLMRAQRVAAGGDASAVVFALIAELARVDGRKVVYEDVLEMDLADVLALQAEVVGENFERPPQRASQDSFDPDSRSGN